MTNPKGFSSQIPTRDESINFSREISVGSHQFMEEPDVKEAEEKIWKSQVIIVGTRVFHKSPIEF